MSTIAASVTEVIERSSPPRVPPLRNGDRLSAEEYMRRYEATAPSIKAELIKGVVYMASPVSVDHAGPHFDLITWLGVYRAYTPGVLAGDNATTVLDNENRPQPDGLLRLDPACGGRARRNEDGYLEGMPELVAEVAVTSANYDLHDKLDVYLEHGAREYVVWRVWDEAIDWFVLRDKRFERLPAGTDGILRSEAFPGLWLDPAALLRGDLARVIEVAQLGIAAPERAAFVERLRQAASPPAAPTPPREGK